MSEMLIMTLEFPLSDSRKRSVTLTSRQRDLSSVLETSAAALLGHGQAAN